MQKVADKFYEYNFSIEILSVPGAPADLSTTEAVLEFVIRIEAARN